MHERPVVADVNRVEDGTGAGQLRQRRRIARSDHAVQTREDLREFRLQVTPLAHRRVVPVVARDEHEPIPRLNARE